MNREASYIIRAIKGFITLIIEILRAKGIFQTRCSNSEYGMNIE